MVRQRVSTTVDGDLLEHARALNPGATDASMIEQALRALLDRHRAAQIDADYERAWAEHPMSEPDEWGDLQSFSDAVRK